MALLRRASFWPPSLVYISVNNTQTFTNYPASVAWCICQRAEYIMELYYQGRWSGKWIQQLIHACYPFDLWYKKYLYSNLNNPVTYFYWNIFAFAGIWTQELTGTKPICYQLSYPGISYEKLFFVIVFKMIWKYLFHENLCKWN